MVTFNQINKAFNDIAVAHRQINTYGIGDIWEIATSGTIRYPMMWAVPQDGRIEKNIYVSSWQLLFIDLVGNGEVNENDVISDMEQIAFDVVALLQDPDYDFDFKGEGIVVQRFTERFDDMVSGVSIKIEIRVPFASDRCAVPQVGLSVGSNPDVVVIYNITTGEELYRLTPPYRLGVYQNDGNLLIETGQFLNYD